MRSVKEYLEQVRKQKEHDHYTVELKSGLSIDVPT